MSVKTNKSVQSLAAAIRAERARVDLTQAQLADLVGVSRPVIVSWEAGAVSPRHSELVKMSRAFKKAVHEWMPG